MKNLLAEIPADLPEEAIDILVQNEGVRIERIVSTGQSSPEGFWYDQREAEWVVVLRGCGHLEFEGQEEVTVMRPGDFVEIPPGRRHRVAWTSQDEPTVWLAFFYQACE